MPRELDLKMLMGIMRKRVWLIVLIITLSSTATGVFSYIFIKPTYQASTKLIINSSADQTGLVKLDLNSVNTNISLINTYKEIIKTPAIMDIVSQEHPEFNMSADQLITNIKLSSVNETQVLTISLEDGSYEKAAQVVNAVSYVFQNQIPKIMKVDNVILLNQADASKLQKPIKPNSKLNIALSILVSLMISVGSVFLLEYFDDSIKTEAEVQRYLNLPTLAMITLMGESDLKREGEMMPTRRKVGEISNVQIR